MRAALGFVAIVLLGACVHTTPPTRNMVYASAAMKAADRAQAERKSPDLYRKAENAYWRAKQLYLAKEYSEATKYATLARRLAEQAEADAELRSADESR